MVQGTFTRKSGTAQNGVYEATIPNPVASSPAGTMKTLYYLIIADDNDDAAGPCDHSTTSPASGTHSVVVTNPGSTPGLGVCEPCTSDAQCGGPDDNCITVGTGTFCSKACGGGLPYCPDTYHCSPNAIVSVDGKSSRQCKPTVGYCGPPPMMMCTEDMHEENDSRTAAKDMANGTYQHLAFCPGAMSSGDEDWYGLTASGAAPLIDAKIQFLTGTDYSDLDLQLVDGAGVVVNRSYGFTDTEQIVQCASSKMFLRVFTFDSAPVKQNLYDLTVNVGYSDVNEPNDTQATGKSLTGLGVMSGVEKSFPNLRICPNDQDWYRISLFNNEVLTVNLVFSQTTADQDLDVYLYKGNNMTPVAMATGTVSNETLMYNVGASGADLYHIQVRGKTAAASNVYEMKVLYQ
jgi:hypothetical protein